jgi:secreted PhoX family phosphatase
MKRVVRRLAIQACLRHIINPEVKVITIEDPVEYFLKGAEQTQVSHKDSAMSFANLLRSALRRDPDIVLLGEIRDAETAETAVEAAPTGHLIFTTIHANSALAVVDRLIDLGVHPDLVASALAVVGAQRLVRRVAPQRWDLDRYSYGELNDHYGLKLAKDDESRKKTVPGPRLKADFEPGDPDNYQGRSGVHEFQSFDSELKEAIRSGARGNTLWTLARERGLRTLLEDGIAKVQQGLTSFEDLALIFRGRSPHHDDSRARTGFGSHPDTVSCSGNMDRRSFLRFVGLASWSVAASACAPRLAPVFAPPLPGRPWGVVPFPSPLPNDVRSAEEFRTFQVIDDLVLPPEFEYRVIGAWGDRFGAPGHEVTFGYNCDFTAVIPRRGVSGEFWLIVNHEYVSVRPWTPAYPEVIGGAVEPLRLFHSPDDRSTKGYLGLHDEVIESSILNLRDPPPNAAPIIAAAEKISEQILREVGVSVWLTRVNNGHLEIIADSKAHKRIFGHGRQNVPATMVFQFTGPTATMLPEPKGTFGNCGGQATPWGTALTCEENIQEYVVEEVTPKGEPLLQGSLLFSAGEPDRSSGLPVQWEGMGLAVSPVLDSRCYGWVCEVDPESGMMRKHSSLGRFRHENVGLRVRSGEKLVAYMGDDRRGGHIYKFVSDKVVQDPTDPSNHTLLEQGTLFVAHFQPDFTGTWVPLHPSTPLAEPEPEYYATRHVVLPRRPAGGFVHVGTRESEFPVTSVGSWKRSVESFSGKPFEQMVLGDLIDRTIGDPLAVILLDAYAMANAVGGTPCARPEDVEVHPHDQSVYIAFTDFTGRKIGSPDMRIFPDSRGDTSRQYGAIYRLVEERNDPGAVRFVWGKWCASGEVADGASGFASADNMAFSPKGELFVMCDIGTDALNFPVSREGDTAPGKRKFAGIFGNNSIFRMDQHSDGFIQPVVFATAPMEAELTGLSFVPGGDTMVLSVQHPGEFRGRRVNAELDERAVKLALGDGTIIEQRRTVPTGSNFPSGKIGDHPRPAVVSIRRKLRSSTLPESAIKPGETVLYPAKKGRNP